ncbi:MarR family winged helix-turn-helix transcriptional regulator [Flaviflexus huanghaiensis]|uniref:MarR family winged helix-turn-helix transcriptional regulator n=1 Tax=Flaviflexus huanghaiensis TaxID=1111473 RepID=UPI0015F873D9|nr:MarR family transcriptional regulator [Flaviflexus huanghaiensis]
MSDIDSATTAERVEMYSVASNDPTGTLIDTSAVTDADIEQINRMMQAFSALRDAERASVEASAKYMALSEVDMRALHFIMVSENQQRMVTASLISGHLKISPATTTKLLDRLERGGHIYRKPHPTDRRSLQILISDETRTSAYETVGKLQSRRFHAAARLTPEEREVVIRFLNDMAQEIDMKHADWGQGA